MAKYSQIYAHIYLSPFSHYYHYNEHVAKTILQLIDHWPLILSAISNYIDSNNCQV